MIAAAVVVNAVAKAHARKQQGGPAGCSPCPCSNAYGDILADAARAAKESGGAYSGRAPISIST